MTLEEAYAEMKKRGWGFSRMFNPMIGVGPIVNKDYESEGEHPIINILAMDDDPVRAVQKAIAVEKGNES